jgi:hypothetical protein
MTFLAVSEARRVRHHLAGAEAMMRARDLSGLSPAQRSMRAFVVAELRRYRLRGVFPRNHYHHELTPQFVDEHGVRCAMAHLLHVTGFDHVVERVRRAKNDVRIRELGSDAELLAWLLMVGMTLEEAARVQPTYCFVPKGECLCDGAGSEAVIEATVVSGKARVDVVYGATTQVKQGDLVPTDYGYGFVEGDVLLGGVRARVGDAGNDTGVDGGTASPNVVFTRLDRALSCGVVSASKKDVIDAWLAKDCVESLKSKNAVYGEPSCKDDPGGCNAASRGPADVAAFALVIAGFAVVARVTRGR